MPKGQLTINSKDAYAEWGISMDSSALSALMTPAPIKDLIENDSRLEHGKSMVVSYTKTGSDNSTEEVSMVKVGSRDVTLTFNLTAKSEEEFLAHYWSFCSELEKGTLDISTSFLPDVVFHMIYQSCQQFSEFLRGIGKFTLRLTEPNPKDRT